MTQAFSDSRQQAQTSSFLASVQMFVELMQAPDGRVVRFRVEFLPFYDRGFYDSQRRRFGLPSKLQRKGAA